MSLFLRNIEEHISVMVMLKNVESQVLHVGKVAAECLHKGGKIFLCGNGGSAADSQHIAAELTGRFIKDRRPLAAIALSTDTSALTCISNDYSFDEIFSRQVSALANDKDLLIGISTSGNSKNVIRAIDVANELGLTTIGLLGRNGGLLKETCDISVVVPSDVTARIQECHILIGHTLCGLIEKDLGF